MAIIHPHKNDKGEPVYIKRPHVASNKFTWHDPSSVETYTPGSAVPTRFNDTFASVKTAVQEKPFNNESGLNTAAGIVVVHGDKTALISPSNEFGGYRYTFPKGRVDKGEDMQRAAIRETHEETGLHVQPIHHLGDYERSTSKARMYVGMYTHGSPADMGWETQAVHFVPTRDLHNYVHTPVDHQIVDDLHKHLGIK